MIERHEMKHLTSDKQETLQQLIRRAFPVIQLIGLNSCSRIYIFDLSVSALPSMSQIFIQLI